MGRGLGEGGGGGGGGGGARRILTVSQCQMRLVTVSLRGAHTDSTTMSDDTSGSELQRAETDSTALSYPTRDR